MDGREDGEHNKIGFVEISSMSAMQDNFSLERQRISTKIVYNVLRSFIDEKHWYGYRTLLEDYQEKIVLWVKYL